MRETWIVFFLRVSFVIVLLLIVVLRYFIRGYMIKNPVIFFKDKITAQLYKNNRKWMDKVAAIILFIMLGYLFYSGMVPLLKDYPLLKQNNYNTIIGITASSSMNRGNIANFRNLQIRDLYSDEIIVVYIFSQGIEKNEYIVVNYLPNSKTGYVVKHQKLQ